jgi:hypothetical protein
MRSSRQRKRLRKWTRGRRQAHIGQSRNVQRTMHAQTCTHAHTHAHTHIHTHTHVHTCTAPHFYVLHTFVSIVLEITLRAMSSEGRLTCHMGFIFGSVLHTYAHIYICLNLLSHVIWSWQVAICCRARIMECTRSYEQGRNALPCT